MAMRRKTLVREIESLSDAEMDLIDLLVRIAVRSRTPIRRRKPILSAAEADKKFRAKTEKMRVYHRGRASGMRVLTGGR